MKTQQQQQLTATVWKESLSFLLLMLFVLVLHDNIVMGFQIVDSCSPSSSCFPQQQLSSSLSSSKCMMKLNVAQQQPPFEEVGLETSSCVTSDKCIVRRTAIQKVVVTTASSCCIPYYLYGTTTASAAAALAADVPTTTTTTTTPTTTTTTTTGNTNKNSIIINQLLDGLRSIPTFCIVSNTTGAAYMIYKRDLNMGIGYAFMTYDGALTVLNEAKENANQKGYSATWTNATITTIPLDVAIRLSLKKRTRIAINNQGDDSKVQSLDTLLQIIPGANERLDGMAIDKSRFQDQGRVPLFYILNDDSTTNNDNSSITTNTMQQTIFYLNRNDLIRDWTKQQQQDPTTIKTATLPNVGAIDLLGIFESLLLGRNIVGGGSNNNNNNINNILFATSSTGATIPIEFVGNPRNIIIAKEMKKNGVTPYNPNQMIL